MASDHDTAIYSYNYSFNAHEVYSHWCIQIAALLKIVVLTLTFRYGKTTCQCLCSNKIILSYSVSNFPFVIFSPFSWALCKILIERVAFYKPIINHDETWASDG